MNEVETTRKIPKMLTVRQTAKEANMSEYFIRNLIRKNEIYYVKSGSKYLINYDLFIDYLYGGYKTSTHNSKEEK